jgi:sugar/nucleoside kinase (ribokinase family)
LAVTLSDMSMINFCRPGVEAMVGDGVDYLFCNEEEAQVWFGETDLDVVCKKIAALARVVCLTRSAKGCLVIEGERITMVAATPVKAIDSNGAGDMFAGAFLYAVTHGHSTAKAAALGNLAAAQVVSQYGCRLSQDSVEALVQQFTKM